jgi:creatinine amidohydrolase
MRWEELSGEAFARGVEACRGVCLLPVGVLEYHGPHLPLGTDLIRAHRMACDVAAVESAIVFPALPFTMNLEAKIYPGSVAVRERLAFDLLENICEEIARNGLHKIVIFSGHGGNKWFLPHFVMSMLDKNNAFVPYFLNNRGEDPQAVGGYMDFEVFRATFTSETFGHADEWEASEILHVRPDLVHLEEVGGREWPAEDRLTHLPHSYTPADWFSRQPDLTRGAPAHATAEKGRVFWEHQVGQLATIVNAIKEDEVAGELYHEFNQRLYRR